MKLRQFSYDEVTVVVVFFFVIGVKFEFMFRLKLFMEILKIDSI